MIFSIIVGMLTFFFEEIIERHTLSFTTVEIYISFEVSCFNYKPFPNKEKEGVRIKLTKNKQ